MNRSDLGSSGFTRTHSAGHEWAGKQVLSIRKAIGNNPLPAQGHMWAYRHDGCEMLAINVTCGDRVVYDGTITGNDGEYESELSGDEAYVPDMIEAIHLAGIIFASLNIPVQIGLLENEVNENLVSNSFEPGQTNAPMRLF